MNKEALESKVAMLFNKSEEEKSEVFSLFKEKIASYLKVGEAIKIESLGVFQLKEQLAHSDSEKPLYSTDKSKTLVYSPESGESSGDSLFINLELDKKIKDDTEFDENVFKLGIGKPIATLSEKDNLGSEFSENLYEALEKNISILLNDSEKLQKFDLWEDYLKNKETKTILDEESKIDDIVDTLLDQEIEEENEKSLLDDFEPLAEDEILNNYVDENDFINDDDINKIVDEIDNENPEFEIPLDELDNENFEVEQEEEFDDVSIDTQDILDELNNNNENLEEEINDKISDQLDNVEHANISDEKIVEDNIEEVDMGTELDNEIDKLDLNLEDEEVEVEEQINEGSENSEEDESINEEKLPFRKEGEVRYIQTKRKKSPLIYLLIAAFLLIGAIGIYYLFFDNPTWLYDQHEVEVQLSQQHAKELEEARLKALEEEETEAISSNVNNENMVENQTNENTDENLVEEIVPTKKEDSEPIEAKVTNSEPQTNTSNAQDEEVEKNIYYDGNVYNVQVSSWKQEKFAKLEVSKLMKKGFPAFYAKVFIPKFNSTWHRVRIGPYTTLQEAKENQKKLKK